MRRLFHLLAVLALLGQVLAGALVVPDDARAASFDAISRSSIHCGGPVTDDGDRPGSHGGKHDGACPLSLLLAPHAAFPSSPMFVPLPRFAVRTSSVVRPLAPAPLPRRLGAFPPPRGPPLRS